MEYPGQNNLGKILENIRENYLPVSTLFEPSNQAKGITYTSTPMATSTMKVSKKRRMPSSNSKTPAKQKPAGKSSFSASDATNGISDGATGPLSVTTTTPISEENSESLKVPIEGSYAPTTDDESNHPDVLSSSLKQAEDTDNAENPVNREKEKLTQSQAMEVDELTFSDTLYQSYDAKNVTNKDGSLNVEKIQSWGLPALNTSRLMEVTGYGTDAARARLNKLLSAQNTGENYIEMDISKATPVETVRRKTLTASRQSVPISEKQKLDELLEKV